MRNIPTIASSFFQAAFAWYDLEERPHLVAPGHAIGSRQGAIRTAEIDLDRPVLCMIARPAI